MRSPLVDHDQRACGPRARWRRHEHDLDAGLGDLACPPLPEVVVAHLGHHGGVDPERSEPDGRVRGRSPTSDLDLTTDRLDQAIEVLGLGKRHRPACKAETIDLPSAHPHPEIHDRRPQRYHVSSGHTASLPVASCLTGTWAELAWHP